MPHIDELTLMMYSDGELSSEEAEAVQKHVDSCHHCGSSLEQLVAERQFVADRFFSDDLPYVFPALRHDLCTDSWNRHAAQANSPPLSVAHAPAWRQHSGRRCLLPRVLAANLA